jgi:hypothetical protein
MIAVIFPPTLYSGDAPSPHRELDRLYRDFNVIGPRIGRSSLPAWGNASEFHENHGSGKEGEKP